MKVTVLGSGGWIPTAQQETACYMIESGGVLILLDAGTGLSNLGRYREVLQQHETIHIVLSHYHMDHIIGLSFLPVFCRNHTVWIHGPGEPAYPKGAGKILSDFFCEPFSSSPVEDLAERLFFADYHEGLFNVGNVTFKAFRQSHSHPSFGLKVENSLFYATDTGVSQQTFERAAGVSLMLHECWTLEPADDPYHSSLEQIIQKLAPNTGGGRLGLIHRNPRWGNQDRAAAKSRIASAKEKINGWQIELVEDHQVFQL
ncbi:MAG: MBL fold metallo-hydrolase [Bacillota bacterium]|nr:MBL fold metallo-hydrolase [Bacillota bacterium]MDW7677509.1 MBL fold metallo-hydrolase [Bacillota bacterium]